MYLPPNKWGCGKLNSFSSRRPESGFDVGPDGETGDTGGIRGERCAAPAPVPAVDDGCDDLRRMIAGLRLEFAALPATK